MKIKYKNLEIQIRKGESIPKEFNKIIKLIEEILDGIKRGVIKL